MFSILIKIWLECHTIKKAIWLASQKRFKSYFTDRSTGLNKGSMVSERTVFSLFPGQEKFQAIFSFECFDVNFIRIGERKQNKNRQKWKKTKNTKGEQKNDKLCFYLLNTRYLSVKMSIKYGEEIFGFAADEYNYRGVFIYWWLTWWPISR